MEMLKQGARGEDVKKLQTLLKLIPDGEFGPKTKEAVIKSQLAFNLRPDGIVGDDTWKMLLAHGPSKEAIDKDTDVNDQYYTTNFNQLIHKYYLPKGEYLPGPVKNEYIFLHHTAGGNDPYKCIDMWGKDDRGKIATEFVLGGQNHKTNNNDFDGVMVKAFPTGAQGWHLGKTGSGNMNSKSVGIEVCSMGFLTKDLKTYVGTVAAKEQVIELKEPFKGYTFWHAYSEKQIVALEQWIKYVAERDNIDIRVGLVQWIKKFGPTKAFEFQQDAYDGKVKGLLTHTNVRRDKFDCYPHPDLIDMLLSL
jgi:peptidoglycan hydrolase-like protein with peptidoglycan-binding domain